MRTLGVIGGVGPESTIDYYRLLIAEYRKRRSDGSYPPVIINSIDLQKLISLVEASELAKLTEWLVDEVCRLARAGAGLGLLASNTPHMVFDEVCRQSPIPLISIVRAACDAAQKMGLRKLGLLGARFTMKASFYQEVFSKAGITCVVPTTEEQAYIHEKYMGELVKGVIVAETRAGLLRIVARLEQQEGIQGLILGGTELPLILRDASDRAIPFLDTTQIHVKAVVQELLTDEA